MKSNPPPRWVAGLAVLLLLGSFSVAPAQAPKPDLPAEKARVQEVLENLNKAIVTENINLYAQQINPDKLTGYGVGSRNITRWDKLKPALQKGWADLDQHVFTFKNRDIQVHDSGEVAWFAESYDYECTRNGKPIQIQDIRTTGVMEKKDGKWQVVQIHTSFPISKSNR